MENQVVVSPFQQVTNSDHNNFALFPTQSLDTLAKDAVTDGKAFVGFTVTKTGQTEVTVGNGRYWKEGQRFYNASEAGVEIDLLTILPAVTRKIVAIVVWGEEVLTNGESRAYKNPQTGQTYSDVANRERRRVANVDRVPGQENVDPQPPAVDANAIVIAHVLCDPTGIVSVSMIEANRLQSLKTQNTRLTLLEKRMDQAGSQIETLRSDIGGISKQLGGKANQLMVTQLAMDVARVMREVELPNDYIGWDSDDFRDDWKTDDGRAGYAAYVKSGLRFDGTQGLSALALMNNIDDRILVTDNMVAAAPTLVKRLSVVGKDGEIALASYQTAETQMVKQVESRKVLEWTKSAMKTNPSIAGWSKYAALDSGPADVSGYAAPGSIAEVNARSYVRGYVRKNPTTGVEEVLQFSHVEYLQLTEGELVPHVHETWKYGTVKTVEDVTWVTTEYNKEAEGHHAAQTFLNSQSGTVAGVNLFFTSKAVTGDVNVVLAECLPNGLPDPNQIVTEATVTAANITADTAGLTPTYFPFVPKQLVKGRRYGIWIVTQGSHWLATISGEKFAQGAAFVVNNDVWNQLGAEIDLPFELFFHGYSQTRVEVQLQPVTLAGGIRYLEINADVVEPEGTEVVFEAKTSGGWFPLPIRDDMTNPLLASPSTIQLRAVLIGTTDDMPKFGIGATRSCVTARRESTTFTHFSEILTLESAADTVEVRLKGYDWDPAEHTLTVSVLRGAGYATVETPDLVTDLPLPALADGAFYRNYSFTLGAAATTYVIKIEGVTTEVGNDFVVSERTSVAYDA